MMTADVLLFSALALFVGAVGLSVWAGLRDQLWLLLVALAAGVASAALIVESTVVGS